MGFHVDKYFKKGVVTEIVYEAREIEGEGAGGRGVDVGLQVDYYRKTRAPWWRCCTRHEEKHCKRRRGGVGGGGLRWASTSTFVEKKVSWRRHCTKHEKTN